MEYSGEEDAANPAQSRTTKMAASRKRFMSDPPHKREESKPTHSDSEPETNVNPHLAFTGQLRNWLALRFTRS
jgi:hypothetical protein